MKSPKLKQKKTVQKTKKVVAKKKKQPPVVAKKAAKKKAPAKPKQVVVISPVDPNSRMVVAAEIADDEIIEAELMGSVLPYFIYEFKQGDKVVAGLTVKGVNEVVRKLNQKKDSGVKIRINPEHMKIEHNLEVDGQKGVQVSVYAENLLDGNSAWGVKFESYQKTKKGGGVFSNEFAVEKAMSKAERNAKRKLIPETMATKMIQAMMEDPDSVKKLTAPANQQRLATVKEQKPSTIEEVQQIIRNAIANSINIDHVLEFDDKTQKDKRFTKEFKAEVRKLASDRVDSLQNK